MSSGADPTLLATIATVTLYVLLVVAMMLGGVIVFGRASRRRKEARRAKLAAPARMLLLSIAAGDDDPEQLDELVRLSDPVWNAVEPNAVALLDKIRGEARAALVSVFERRGAAWRARSQLKRTDPVLRARAADILGTLGRTDAVPALCTLLGDRDPDVRAVAARALGTIGDAAAARPLLSSLASRRRSIPTHFVAHALMRLGADAHPVLMGALHDPYREIRATAAEVLGLAGAIGASGKVEAVLRDDTSVPVRVRAARSLGRLGTRSAVAPLVESLAPDRPPALRAAAAAALGELGAVNSAPALTGLLDDFTFEVAHEAAHSLLRLGKTGRAALVAERDANDRPRAAAHAREALAVAELDEQRKQLTAAPG